MPEYSQNEICSHHYHHQSSECLNLSQKHKESTTECNFCTGLHCCTAKVQQTLTKIFNITNSLEESSSTAGGVGTGGQEKVVTLSHQICMYVFEIYHTVRQKFTLDSCQLCSTSESRLVPPPPSDQRQQVCFLKFPIKLFIFHIPFKYLPMVIYIVL